MFALAKAPCITVSLLASPLFRHDFKPVVIWVGHEIDSHFGVFVADAAHFGVAFVGSFVIINLESQVKFVVAEIVGTIHFPQPCQLKLVAAVAVFQINDDEAAVFSVDSADFVHIKGILIEFYALVKIENVQVIVDHAEFHCFILL